MASCNICFSPVAEIVTHCGHTCCQKCFLQKFRLNPNYPQECFYCSKILTDEVFLKYLSDEEASRYLKSKSILKRMTDKSVIRCLDSNCDGETGNSILNSTYSCPKCMQTNCLSCNAIHKDNETCLQWQANNQELINDRQRREADVKAKINSQQGMHCVNCGLFCQRDGGCFGIKCPQCKTYLCIITQKARYGPQGKGDTSGGCMCGYPTLCHPACQSCTI